MRKLSKLNLRKFKNQRNSQTKETFPLEINLAREVVDEEKQVFIEFHLIYHAKEQDLIRKSPGTFWKRSSVNPLPWQTAHEPPRPAHFSSCFSSAFISAHCTGNYSYFSVV